MDNFTQNPLLERRLKLPEDNKSAEKMTENITEPLLGENNEISDIKDRLMNLYTRSETDRKELEAKHERLIQICRDVNEEKQTLKQLNTVLMSDISRLKNDVASLQQKEMLLENYYTQQMEARSDTIEDQAHQIKQLHEEKNCLLIRLSKIAEDRLSHKNVNIADLSDDDRPIKLSEVYLELYRKEWTDAFEELTGKCSLSDENAIELLLGILLNAFQKCREITWKRYEVMKSVAVTQDITQNKNQERSVVLNPEESKSASSSGDPGQVKEPQYNQSEKEIPARLVKESNHNNTSMETEKEHWIQDSRLKATLQLSLSVDQEKEITTVWKQLSHAIKTQALELVRSILMSGFGVNDKDMPNVSRYLISCVEICWKMGLQEKPLHLDIDAERKIGPERIFDDDKFKAYTKSGMKVAYVVWPALFLHEGGQLLTKGIAQGY